MVGDYVSPASSSGPAAVAWQAEENSHIQHVTEKSIIYDLIHQQTQTLQTTVPWFLRNMPSSYFRQVPEVFRMDHIKSIATVKDANMDLYLNLQAKLPDGRKVLTFIRPTTCPGTLLKMVQELPRTDTPLSRLHVFSTADESMSLNMFVYGHRPVVQDRARAEDLGSVILNHYDDLGTSPESNPSRREELIEHLQKCTETYIQIGSNDPARFLRQWELVERVSGSEGTAVSITEATAPSDLGNYWVDMAVANALPQAALENLCRLLFHHEFDVDRARLDIVPDGANGKIVCLRALIRPVNGNVVNADVFDRLARGLKRSKWLDDQTMSLVFEKFPWLGVTRGEVITGCCSLLHPVLSKENAIAFSKANIHDTICRFMPLAARIADLFLERFDPADPLDDETFEAKCSAILQSVEDDVEDRIATEILVKMVDIVRKTLKTNVYMRDRYALGFRLDPSVMVSASEADEEKPLPFGTLFVHGKRFDAFHVRFRDISRGGMRLVTPHSAEQYALESTRQYDECYGLAFAQQLKNKDIPEGGSKAVNLIDTIGLSDSGKNFVMRKCVKAFTDTILDLIVEDDIVDLYGQKEVLYLGPDEQVIPEDIEWIVKRAAVRGYGTPAAFMSSKPRAGINHKEYGVTSEGVNVYLDVAIRHVLGLNPSEDSFTVKMTGGPDGDVAGNEMKILFREYGDNVKIIGVADHSGCAEDPTGLNREELLRLVHDGLSIANFDGSKLSHDGVVHTCDTPDGVKARNSMHNRLEADAFLPCGGRPNTIDITNYQHFLKPDGTPSSPLIVEGANLFVTAEARQALFDDAGVVIVKDSSANKGGVITSSYEICAAMLLSEDEFFASKEQIVDEVLDKLRELAYMEANMLFREFENFGGSLPKVSQIISECINVATDALTAQLATLTKQDREALLPLFRQHLPKTLADLSFDHVHERVPDQYIQSAISSCLASKMVYKEGTKFIGAQPKEKLAAIALKYIEKEKEIALLKEALADADMPEDKKQTIVDLLEAGGARTSLGVY